MHGDFSRSHHPDSSRGRDYARVFAQQRRLLLDSDINAIGDAMHERLRRLSRHLGCPQGSSDLGFLVTSGGLLQEFSSFENVVSGINGLSLVRDYRRKLLDRFPALRLRADKVTQVTQPALPGGLPPSGWVTISLRGSVKAGMTIRLWCAAEKETKAAIRQSLDKNNKNYVEFTVPHGQELQAVDVSLPWKITALHLYLPARATIWLGMIEAISDSPPLFHVAAGSFYLDGLPLSQAVDEPWSPALMPQKILEDLGLLEKKRVLVYLEGWERHVSAVEDPGIREIALGGDSDTSSRGRAVGRVKLALVPDTFDDATIDRMALGLRRPLPPLSTLEVNTPPAPQERDPCALPVDGGYTGRDNRLYRFEVHDGGEIGTAMLKWSRDNGAELFAVTKAEDQSLHFPADTPLRTDDLVEVLTLDSVELSDKNLAKLTAKGLRPANRSVGKLVRLGTADSVGTGLRFSLMTLDRSDRATLPPFLLKTEGLKVRRWHGLIFTRPSEIEVEHNLRITVGGSDFQPGEFWLYEARASGANDNGPWISSPHGPERAFAPLALMKKEAANAPLKLVRWLDERFLPLCELDADAIAFDPARIGSSRHTVQEIIEELWERSDGGCCEFRLREDKKYDTAARIREILARTTGEVTICLEPGVYEFHTTLNFEERTVVLKGCPRAVLEAKALPMVHVGQKGRLELEELILYGRAKSNGVSSLIELDPFSSLEARATGLVLVPEHAEAIAVVVREAWHIPVPVNSGDPTLPLPKDYGLRGGGGAIVVDPGPCLVLRDCVGCGSWIIAVEDADRVELENCSFKFTVGCVTASLLRDLLISKCILWAVDLYKYKPTPRDLLADASNILNEQNFVGQEGEKTIGVRSMFCRGLIRNCHFAVGLCGLACTIAGDLRSESNHYEVRTDGQVVRFGYFRASGDVIYSEGNGVTVSQESDILINDCRIEKAKVGLRIMDDSTYYGSSLSGSVQVLNNTITCSDYCMWLGRRRDQSSWLFQQPDISISGNRLNSGMSCIDGDWGQGLPNPPLGTIRIHHNVCSVGLSTQPYTHGIFISINNAIVEVIENHIEMPLKDWATGIALQFCEEIICDSNLIDYCNISQSQQTPLIDFIEAVHIENCNSARIDSNTINDVGKYRLKQDFSKFRGFCARSCLFLSMSRNSFATGDISVSSSSLLPQTQFTATGNRFSGSIDIDAGYCILSDNRVFPTTLTPVKSVIVNVKVGTRCLVSANMIEGSLMILPWLESTGSVILRSDRGLDLLPDQSITMPSYGSSSTQVLPILARLAGDEVFSKAVFPNLGSLTDNNEAQQQTPRYPLQIGEPTGSSLDMTYPVNIAEWTDAYAEALARFVAYGATSELGETLIARIMEAQQQQEKTYYVLCNANQASNLTIGSSDEILASGGSHLQVIANQVNGVIDVKDYGPGLMFSLNLASQYRRTGNPHQGPVVVSNMLI